MPVTHGRAETSSGEKGGLFWNGVLGVSRTVEDGRMGKDC